MLYWAGKAKLDTHAWIPWGFKVSNASSRLIIRFWSLLNTIRFWSLLMMLSVSTPFCVVEWWFAMLVKGLFSKKFTWFFGENRESSSCKFVSANVQSYVNFSWNHHADSRVHFSLSSSLLQLIKRNLQRWWGISVCPWSWYQKWRHLPVLPCKFWFGTCFLQRYCKQLQTFEAASQLRRWWSY